MGTLYRKGRVRSTKAFQAFDHDFPSWAEGVVIPHGIYDPVLNLGHINIGLSHDTSQFACDSFKYDLERLSQSIGLEIRVAHYPPYCSKYNWIERRFFPHVGRACSGMLFDTIDTVVRLMRRASTSTGLKTTVNVIRRSFETGRNATKEMKEQLGIIYDKQLPKWNYRAVPQINQ